MSAATAASAHQQASSSQFADMIVHRLSGQFHASGDARRGIGLEEGGENLQPKWMMEQDSSLGRFANEIETGAAKGRRGVRGAGAGDFPIAGTGDAHGFEEPLPRNASTVLNRPIILSRTILWSIQGRPLLEPYGCAGRFTLARLTVFTYSRSEE
jgi:hypothetical protein